MDGRIEEKSPEIVWDTIPAGRSGWRVTGHDQVKTLLDDRRLDIYPDARTAAKSYDEDTPLHRVIVRLATQPIPEGEKDYAERALRRAALTRMFAPQQLRQLAPAARATADELLDAMVRNGSSADLCDQFSVPFCMRMVGELLDLPAGDIPRIREWAGDQEETDMRRSLLGLKRLMSYVYTLIQGRADDPGSDILSLLLASEAAGDDEHEGLIPNIVAFLLGLGWQGPASAIDFGVLMLCSHPEQLERFRSDPSVRPAAVEEILRLFIFSSANIGGLDRYANCDFEFEGVQIRDGEMVLLDIPAANRDPRVFSEPLTFDITRSFNPHLNFGHGFYYCNFNKVARLELEVGLGALFERFPGLKLSKRPDQLAYRDRPQSGPVELPVVLAGG